MNFVFLYGRPAVGKLTVARPLAELTGYRLFHNHLVVDAALAVYDFGTPGFIAMRDRLWRAAFTQLAQDPLLPGLIFTFNPESSVPQQFIDDLFALFEKSNHRIVCIELVCSEEEIERRIDSTPRRDFKKLTDVALYRTLREQGSFARPVIDRDRLVIDTGVDNPSVAVDRIFELLNSLAKK